MVPIDQKISGVSIFSWQKIDIFYFDDNIFILIGRVQDFASETHTNRRFSWHYQKIRNLEARNDSGRPQDRCELLCDVSVIVVVVGSLWRLKYIGPLFSWIF